MADFHLFTDGACSGNPGPGGWGFVLRDPGSEMVCEAFGQAFRTTNNQMELMAAIEGLEEIMGRILDKPSPTTVVVTSDSKYVIDGITNWIKGWQKRNWRNTKGDPVANRELWEKLDRLTREMRVTWRWVKGHAGHPDNERADRLACYGRDSAAKVAKENAL